jgi:ATPase subunit of ABC transporter with duplicated ATPase domains
VQHFGGTGVSTPTELQARTCLAKMGLTGKTPGHTLIGGLSGGQKVPSSRTSQPHQCSDKQVRLALALLFYDPPNLLYAPNVLYPCVALTIVFSMK